MVGATLVVFGHLFVVQRVGDLINIFIGLWLVPKYIPGDELGAVLPLSQIGGLRACRWRSFSFLLVNSLMCLRHVASWGKLNVFLYDVFVGGHCCCADSRVCALFNARCLSAFTRRVRIFNVARFVRRIKCNSCPVVRSGVAGPQAFSSVAVINAVTAPVRLLVMLVMLPVQGIAGYFSGQLVSETFKIGYAFLH